MFPRIFDRYLGRQVGSATLIGVALLSGVMVLGNVYRKLDQLLGNTELPLSAIAEFVMLVIPFSLIFTIPWAFLTGILLVFGRLSADNELVSLRMTGLSMPRICAPVFILGLLLSGVCLWVNVSLAPAAKDRMKRLFYEVAVQNPETLFQEGQVLERVPGYRIYTSKRDNKTLTDLHIIMMKNAQAETYIHAKKATLHTTPGSIDLLLEMEGMTEESVPSTGRAQPGGFALGRSWLKLPLSEMQKDAVRVNASMKTTSALETEVRTWKDTFTGEPLTDVTRSLSRTELNKRYSFSLACFTFALVGIPLGVTAQRRETSSGFALSLITATVYIVFIILADTLNSKPAAMPHLIMWVPNVIFLGIGGWLFYKLSRK